ncbi:hypothetical protein DDL28_03825 [Staphylococcus aureus]|uniref:Uncharacterized protein n=1 Tax=Staphylococcus aureus TaxID=1280 RepID=A0AAX2YP31_STAAU|nr:hypothetical protein BSG38_13595 [Staphylococcus aureus]EFB94932.1 conserved hypothetical protein [Staphylococcus aureus A10102]EFC04053.1 hypothetical protein SGAG_01219 [Staphylococcus aureus A8117]EFG46072.1 hypothetical protein SMAG_00255 [Staphylococcus aureus A8819]EFH38188.1 hypothetical protein SLAG_00253 [Staphylococcus aureus A8796]EFT84310.1 hypothetical protein CGSSa03_07971 [Staphylococcus aureus subsp. aureus CGS03]KAA2225388.1 hypothetical protein F1583_04605 [Staphylococcus
MMFLHYVMFKRFIGRRRLYSDITMFCKSYSIELLFNYGACSGRGMDFAIVCENLKLIKLS